MPQRSNLSLALNLAAIVVGMLLLTAASVPLYRLFCQATGYNGTTRVATQAPQHIVNRDMIIRFNADSSPGLPWEFRPGQKKITVKVGQQTMTHYVARNLSDHAITGRAVYNVTPPTAGAYFVKVQCFCFKEQTLAPGQQADMPVMFYIDPSIMDDRNMDDLKTITLSYTFFDVKSGK